MKGHLKAMQQLSRFGERVFAVITSETWSFAATMYLKRVAKIAWQLHDPLRLDVASRLPNHKSSCAMTLACLRGSHDCEATASGLDCSGIADLQSKSQCVELTHCHTPDSSF